MRLMKRLVVLAAPVVCFSAAMAQDKSAEAPASKGLLPVPDYTGDLWGRRALTGDWGGERTKLANKGIQLELDWNQYVQGVASGGRDNDTKYGGKGNYVLNVDFMRMGIMDGALLKVRAESRYGESVNGAAGPILPVNTDALFPLTDTADEDIPITVTNLLYTQFLSEKFAVFVGKLDTLDGDPNEFSSGRGTTQFMNANFVFNASVGLRLPYSTLGAGVVWMPAKWVKVSSSIINTGDSSTTTGFEDFGNGVSWTAEADFQYKLGDLPGGQNVGFLYSFAQEFTKLNSRLVLQRGEVLSFQDKDETWAVYWSGWQYLFVEDPSEAPVDLGNGVPDRQGLGLFARVGFADEDTNPLEWSASGGIGGRGFIPSRDNDVFGVGYFYSKIQELRLSGIAGIADHAQGFEAFYNIAITPAAKLTLDVQAVEAPSANLDSAVVLGARLGISF